MSLKTLNDEDSDQSSSKDATIEGEQLSESLTGPESNSLYEDLLKSIPSEPIELEFTSS